MSKEISGGVCAAQGFRAAGVHAGVKTHAAWKKDVTLIVSDTDCAAAALFTKNVVKAAPVQVNMRHVADGKVRAVIANSGNANACAPEGEENALRMCAAAAKAVGCAPEDVMVCSTGVIGQRLNVEAIEGAVPALYEALERSPEASDAAAHAIMTTDTVKKECAVEGIIGGQTVRVGGIAKGSGMIHPNMGTMLCFLTTDCAISQKMLNEALHEVVRTTFNRISVDGDTSTNDTCLILANGQAGNREITELDEHYVDFVLLLHQVCYTLARAMAKDGEGAKHLITCTVSGAETEEKAESLSKSVISSTLTKAAIFGSDANWGRVLCAMGYSGEEFDPESVDISFASDAGEILVCEKGRGLVFDEDLAKKIVTEDEIDIDIALSEGDESCTCWGCDITYDYIKINGDYRT